LFIELAVADQCVTVCAGHITDVWRFRESFHSTAEWNADRGTVSVYLLFNVWFKI